MLLLRRWRPLWRRQRRQRSMMVALHVGVLVVCYVCSLAGPATAVATAAAAGLWHVLIEGDWRRSGVCRRWQPLVSALAHAQWMGYGWAHSHTGALLCAPLLCSHAHAHAHEAHTYASTHETDFGNARAHLSELFGTAAACERWVPGMTSLTRPPARCLCCRCRSGCVHLVRLFRARAGQCRVDWKVTNTYKIRDMN